MPKAKEKQKSFDVSQDQKGIRYRNKDWLQSRIANNLTITEIARKCSVTRSTIRYWREKFQIPFEDPSRKKTTEEFRSEVEEKVGDEYTVLERYEGSKTKIKMRHEKCEYEYKVTPSSFLNGSRCPECAFKKEANPRWKGQDKFEKEVKELVDDEYKVLGQYKGTNQKIEFQHEKCGNKFRMRPHDFLNGERCPKCNTGGKKKKSQDQFEEEVQRLVHDKYSVIGEYKGALTPIKMRHEKCRYEYRVTPSDFLQGNRCPKCGGGPWRDTEIFEQEVEDLVGNEYTVLGEYQNLKKKIEIRHEKCGYEYKVTPDAFLYKQNRCPKCAGNLRKDTDDFKEEVQDLVGDEYTVIGKYKNAKTKIRMQHEECGNQFEMRPHDFLNGQRCPKCAMKIRANSERKSQDQFEQEIENLVGDEYAVLGQYKGAGTKIEIKHEKCGYKYKVEPFTFLEGYGRCPICGKDFRSVNTQIFKDQVQDVVGNKYSVLGEYEARNTKIKMRHEKCGYEYKTTPSNFLSGCRCPKCAGNLKKDTDDFKEEIKNLVGDKYKVTGQYERSNVKIMMKHEKCGHEFKVRPAGFLQGPYCPYCSNSKGEAKVKDILEQENLNFKPQLTFEKCRDERKLPFDFGVFNKNNELRCLIEYDSIIHYRLIEFFGGKESFKQRMKRDHIKDQFALENDIPLLRVNYMDRKNDKVGDHVKNFLKENNIFDSM